MPLKNYFKGSGEKVMQSMKKTYKSDAKAEDVFYATANKQGMKPDSPVKKAMKKAMNK
jgi:hypothetical protein